MAHAARRGDQFGTALTANVLLFVWRVTVTLQPGAGMVALRLEVATDSGQPAVHVIVGVAPLGYSAVMSALSVIANELGNPKGPGTASQPRRSGTGTHAVVEAVHATGSALQFVASVTRSVASMPRPL